MQTAERVSSFDYSDNVIYQRHLVAYHTAKKYINGKLLEVGSGEGYGIPLMINECAYYTAVDKFPPSVKLNQIGNNFVFKKMKVPPLEFENDCFDSLVSFQVIEHIEEDEVMIAEMARVLKTGGKAILTTPNRLMSLTRNPWHIREYTWQQLQQKLSACFSQVEVLGIYGNEEIDAYYEKNKSAVNEITKYDIFNLQHKLPRQLLQIPYDILNRLNRKKLMNKNNDLVKHIQWEDFTVKKAAETCYDLFAVATK